jgi:hypothetical protein
MKVKDMKNPNIFLNRPMALLYSTGISIILLIADYFAGPFIQFPITYLVPISIVSWFNGRRWGFLFAFVMPMIRLLYNLAFWSIPWTFIEASTNALIRIVVLSSFVVLIDRTANQSRKLSAHVDLLEGMLPICSFCKRIRDKNNQWQILEKYITDRSDASFTHGVCPDCMKEHYGDSRLK